MEPAIVTNVEAAWRLRCPFPFPLRSADARVNPLQFLPVLNLREISHDVRDNRVDRPLEGRIVDSDRQANVEALDASLALEGMLDELVNLRRPEPGEMANLVDYDNVVLVGLIDIGIVRIEMIAALVQLTL